jgi:hypothetical protein
MKRYRRPGDDTGEARLTFGLDRPLDDRQHARKLKFDALTGHYQLARL